MVLNARFPKTTGHIMKDHIVVLTGAGMSAESGLSTFRDNGGLWEQYSVYDVATPEAFERNQDMVLRFYNERRRQLEHAQPNRGHQLLAELEKERAALENRVALLHQDRADPDMVGELLRSQLNVVHPDEVVIKLEN